MPTLKPSTDAAVPHDHGHGAELSGSRLQLALVLTVVFVTAEALVGWYAGSLALLSDAGHNLSDGLALALSAFAVWIAAKPATAERTYGFHRAGVLAAVVNAVSLIVVAAVIILEALRRVQHPEPIVGGWMIGTALAAMVVNVVISFWLHKGSREDINIRSAYLHMVWDAVASLAVVVGGVIIALTGQSVVDPLLSIVLSILMGYSSIGILREALHILLEATPRGISLHQLSGDIADLEGVLGCHDLHVWTISSGIVAASVHIVVEEQSVSEAQAIAQRVASLMESRYRISHATVQVETDHCGNGDPVCTLRRVGSEASAIR